MTAHELVEHASGLVFDLDGTLVDTFEDLALALDSALGQHGLPPAPRATVLACIHRGLDHTAHTVLRVNGADPALHGQVVTAYRLLYRARGHVRSQLYAGVREFLAACRLRGRPMAVCTNKPTASARELLAALGVEEHFAAVIGIDACGVAKPDPAPLRLSLQRIGCSADSAVFVGDSVVDAQCARNAGVPFLLHESGFGAEEAISFGCTGRFRAFGELLASLAA